MRPARRRAQSGIGMVLVFGIGVLVMGMGVLAHTLFERAVNTSTRHLSYEQAIHLAEQGVDQTLARVRVDATHNTDAQFGALPEGLSGEAEKTWVVERLTTAAVQPAPGGEVATIKPSNRNVIYAASWVPSRAAAQRTRIVKAEYLPFTTFSPAHAILSGGALEIGGNANVSGIAGHVHANGDVTIQGSADISGNLSSAGTVGEGGNVGGERTSGAPPEDIPSIDPRAVWNQHARSPAYSSDWYDLCPDGSARLPDGATPCTGTVVADTNQNPFRGWRMGNDGAWDIKTDQASAEIGYDGVYYAYHGSFSVSGNIGKGTPWLGTLIAEAETVGTGADGCPLLAQGDIEIRGTPVMGGYLSGLLLMAGRDLKMNGNAQQSFMGVMAAHEQVDVNGNATLMGAIISEGHCDTPGSPINENTVSGSMTITHDSSLEIPVGGDIRTTLWLEL